MPALCHYQAPDVSLWQGRDDAPGQRWFQVIECLDLEQAELPNTGVALLGVASDIGVRRNHGRLGAKQGPAAIRAALARLAWHGQQAVYDVGTIIADDNLEAAQQELAAAVAMLHQAGLQPIVLGGGHEIAWGHFQGLALADKIHDLQIINFDAHFDLRPCEQGLGSSGTPFLQIAHVQQAAGQAFDYTVYGIQPVANTNNLFATADKLNVSYLLASDMQAMAFENLRTHLQQQLASHHSIYLSLCLDVFAASVAPGVSAPSALGLEPAMVLPLLVDIIRSGKVVALDIAELAPPLDRDGQTARLAATLVAEMVHALA